MYRDRYYSDIADKIAVLDKGSDSFNKDICKIFDVEYTEDVNIDLKSIEIINDRISKLKSYTDDEKYRKVIDNIAFNQEELWDLLDEGKTTIYLCGDKFDIPLTKEGIEYIGVNNPIAVIASKVAVDFENKNIKFNNISFDESYKKLLLQSTLLVNNYKSTASDSAYKSTYLRFFISNKAEDDVKRTYDYVHDFINKIPLVENQFSVEEFEIIVSDFWSSFSSPSIYGFFGVAHMNVLTDLLTDETKNPLYLIYNDNLNDYGKIILGDCTLKVIYENRYEYLDPTKRTSMIDFAKKLIKQYNDKNYRKNAYIFILAALFVMYADKKQIENDSLSLICEFIYLLNIGIDEVEDIIKIIKFILKIDDTINFKTNVVEGYLGKIKDLYKI